MDDTIRFARLQRIKAVLRDATLGYGPAREDHQNALVAYIDELITKDRQPLEVEVRTLRAANATYSAADAGLRAELAESQRCWREAEAQVLEAQDVARELAKRCAHEYGRCPKAHDPGAACTCGLDALVARLDGPCQPPRPHAAEPHDPGTSPRELIT